MVAKRQAEYYRAIKQSGILVGGKTMRYRIEWEVAWNPKRTEGECYDYIENRYPKAVYGRWERSKTKGRSIEMVKKCYANQKDKDNGIIKCLIFENRYRPKSEITDEMLKEEEFNGNT